MFHAFLRQDGKNKQDNELKKKPGLFQQKESLDSCETREKKASDSVFKFILHESKDGEIRKTWTLSGYER